MQARASIHYSIIQGIFWSTYASVFGFSSYYLLAKGCSNTQIGYIVAAGSALSAILQPMLGGYVDRSKKMILHPVILVLSMIMIVLSGLLLGFGETFWVVALLYGLLITFLQMITPMTYTLSMFFLSRGVHINFGVARGIGSISYAIVIAILGVLVERWDEDVIIMSVILFYIIFMILIAAFHFRDVSEEKHETEIAQGDEDSFIRFLAENKAFACVLFGNTCVFIGHIIMNNYLYQIVEYHGYGSREMGFASAVAAASELPILFLLAWINRKVSSARLFWTSSVFFFIKNVCLYFATGMPMIYFAMSLNILGYGLFAGISVIYVNETVQRRDQTRGQALMTTTVTLAAVLGSLLGGVLIDSIDVPGMLLVSGIIVLIGAVIVGLFVNKATMNHGEE